MHRIDNSCFLLFIEPPKKKKMKIPVNDEITRIMKLALSEAKTGMSNYSSPEAAPRFRSGPGYKGYHKTACGKRSIGYDYLLENGMITNDLAPFYLQYYRDSIPDSEMKKILKLVTYYKQKYRYKPEVLEQDIPDYWEKDFMTRIREWFDEENE
jgi:hypothetical protein